MQSVRDERIIMMPFVVKTNLRWSCNTGTTQASWNDATGSFSEIYVIFQQSKLNQFNQFRFFTLIVTQLTPDNTVPRYVSESATSSNQFNGRLYHATK